jgi:hypothetical protein
MRATLLVVSLLTSCAAIAPVDAADPRFEECHGHVDTVDATVAFTARDYQDHFPLMGRAPELEVDTPAFAVVFEEGGGPMPITGQIPRPGDEPPVEPAESRHRTVCIYVGQPPDGEGHVYFDVDVALLLP